MLNNEKVLKFYTDNFYADWAKMKKNVPSWEIAEKMIEFTMHHTRESRPGK